MTHFLSSALLLLVLGELLSCGSSIEYTHGGIEISDSCSNCTIENSGCKNDKCMCLDNYEFIKEEQECKKCPGINSVSCTACCDRDYNLKCIDGKCKVCTDKSDNSSCSNNLMQNQHLLLTVTQIAMTGAMMLGIITILTLFWKLCSKTSYRGRTTRTDDENFHGRPTNSSVNSLQREVSERLRDAPPPYRSRLPPPSDRPPAYNSVSSSGAAYVNTLFIGDEMPPDYNSIIIENSNIEDKENSTEEKIEDPNPSTTIHI